MAHCCFIPDNQQAEAREALKDAVRMTLDQMQSVWNRVGCQNLATWDIYDESDRTPDQVTMTSACDEHIGAFLDSKKSYRLVPHT